jgi:Protein kinase domain
VVVPLTSVGPYQLLEPLGGDGLFLCLAPDGERVAVRVIEADVAADPRFRTEVAAARRVDGAFTTPVVAADLDADVPWLATAYVAGSTLADAVRDRGPVPAASLLLLATGLASGLRAIHDAGLVHGDLNPSNVLLDEDGPRVTGFGLSGVAGVAGVAGADLGSPGFLAPEQALGQDAGPPSDIFSLGAVLVYAAGGQGPFGAGSSALLMYRLVNSAADLGGLPGELRSLVGGCLAKQPDSRPTASELVEQLRAASVSSAPSPAPSPAPSSFAGRLVPVAGSGVDRRRGGGRLRRGGRRDDRRRPSVARRASRASGRGGGGPTGFEVAGAADLGLVGVGARGFGAGAALELGARGSGHSGYSPGPVGVLVPELVGSGVGAGVAVFGFWVGFGFCVSVGVGLGIGFCVAFGFGVRLGFCVAVGFGFGFGLGFCVAVAVAVGFGLGFCVAVDFGVTVAVCVLLAFGFLLAIIFGVYVGFRVYLGFRVHVGFRVRVGALFAVRGGEFGLIRHWVSGCVTGSLAASLGSWL